jgi:hypothetical protein
MYQNRTEQRGHHYSIEPTREVVDRELRALSDAQIDRLAAEVDYGAVGARTWETLTTDDRRAWRAGEEQARRRNVAERAAKAAAQQKILDEQEQARVDVLIADYKRAARGAWIGDDASFDRAWPKMLEQWQIETAQQVMAEQHAAVRARIGNAF